ncbi:MAG: Crp/Fnr family transcriptional regulator [Caldilinea sp. CFX5]|nr:Crp/Fnr family transcriptional regulator [Caldilinea sp. CFX5]
MIRQLPPVDQFKQQLRMTLRQEVQQCRTVPFAKHTHIYTCGDQEQSVYFLESGQVKLLMLSPAGNECLLAILTAGDIFGELCLSGLYERTETAVAMTKTVVRVMPCTHFFACLRSAGLLEGFVQYLTVRVADQQEMIANLVTVDSEQRLGKTLLQLARTLGKQDPRSIRIEQRISHEELAAMVGASRPRVSTYMHHFRELGLIEFSAERFLIIKEQKLTDYLAQLG